MVFLIGIDSDRNTKSQKNLKDFDEKFQSVTKIDSDTFQHFETKSEQQILT